MMVTERMCYYGVGMAAKYKVDDLVSRESYGGKINTR